MRVERTLVGLFVAFAVAVAGCQGRLAYNLPPAARLMEPGPGVGGPGPGVIPAAAGMGMGGGVYPASYAAGGGAPYGGPGCGPDGGYGYGMDGGYYGGDGYAMLGPATTSQIAFLGSEGLEIAWDVARYGMFDSVPLIVPGRQDFYQGGIYRLKLTNIPGRPGVELYPSLEIGPVTPRTDAYLAHAPIPVQFTEEDFDQALSGNYVTKVIYLPDPEFQELAVAGVETLVSTRLDPGTDPLAEADHRGAILAVLRMGNKDLESMSRMGGGPNQVIPASYDVRQAAYDEPQAAYDEPAYPSTGMPFESDVVPAQYVGGGGNVPLGMPTAGFAPPAVPPNMIAAAPEWGMPMSGTPIGLPGPPHVPLGTPAGLQKHVMRNRTRVLIPPPNAKVNVSVKQRPGLSYPRPVTHVQIDETRRQPLRLVPTWFTNMFRH